MTGGPRSPDLLSPRLPKDAPHHSNRFHQHKNEARGAWDMCKLHHTIIRSRQYSTSALPSTEAGAGVTPSLSSTESPNLYQPRLPGAPQAACYASFSQSKNYSFQNTPPL